MYQDQEVQHVRAFYAPSWQNTSISRPRTTRVTVIIALLFLLPLLYTTRLWPAKSRNDFEDSLPMSSSIKSPTKEGFTALPPWPGKPKAPERACMRLPDQKYKDFPDYSSIY